MDELWSFVEHKGNKPWGWLAMDAETREIIGCHIGDRWEAYVTVIPSQRHEAVGKDSGLTSDIERLNNTLRQRIARLVRKTLSFCKKLENHIGAIWLFIHGDNRRIRQKIASERQGRPQSWHRGRRQAGGVTEPLAGE